jgi:hypothetical protein
MRSNHLTAILICVASFVFSCDDEKSETPSSVLQLTDIKVGTVDLETGSSPTQNAPVDKPIVVSFSKPLVISSVEGSVTLKESISGDVVPLTFSFLNNNSTFSALPAQNLKPLIEYSLVISDKLQGENNHKFPGLTTQFKTVPTTLTVTSVEINGTQALNTKTIDNIPLTNLELEIVFSAPLDATTILNETIQVIGSGNSIPLEFVLEENNSRIVVSAHGEVLKDLSRYQLVISNQLKGSNGEVIDQFLRPFYTAETSVPKFPLISDEELLTLVQQQTFKYFWDFGHPVSGMARERNTSGDVVTTGGTGFGLMSIVAAIHRNFITREQGIERISKIVNFLATADRFHGAWPHWMNGNTGDVVPFSVQDNGGDLVETSFLIQGMLAVRQFLNPAIAAEASLITSINTLWETVEWDWYTQGGRAVLYWHWSPTVGWAMNHEIRGHNETLITYVLAASSPTHSIPPATYRDGYARNGAIKNGKMFYGIQLPLGEDYGGPLFFTHYSFLGLDPRNLSDAYANYWQQNVNHSLINREYVITNPKDFAGYKADNWGLTASDNHKGYAAHSPLNDLGVITPTAALSSFPYTPEYSMQALKFFYYKLGDRLFGTYGFKDAYSLHEGWYADSYLAIDQGPIIVMIENHRTGLLWDLFMSSPEIQTGLTSLGFSY